MLLLVGADALVSPLLTMVEAVQPVWSVLSTALVSVGHAQSCSV